MNFRNLFHLNNKIYFCSHSLGLPTKDTATLLLSQEKKWSDLGAAAWFHDKDAWYSLFENNLQAPLSNLLGTQKNEVILMNSLTINLHLLLTSFYQPTAKRYKIVMEEPVFSSDLYAIKSHLHRHQQDPKDALLFWKPRDNSLQLYYEDLEKILKKEKDKVALIFFSNVNYLTGQVIDAQFISKLAKQYGCIVGCDFAHAAGNIPLHLHDDQIDFGVGCSYKYLCGGPGAPGIAFIHQKHHHKKLHRLAGWWGNDPETRFHMQHEFIPAPGASGWQVSTPSILAMTPLLSSLPLFTEAGIENLRKKSLSLTQFLLDHISNEVEIITPMERGCQISLRPSADATKIAEKLFNKNIICDVRAPNILRVSLSPLYNNLQDIEYFIACINKLL